MTDLTRNTGFNQKKTPSVAACVINHDEVTTGLNEVFKLPPDCLVTRAYAYAKVAGQAGLEMDVGFVGENLGDVIFDGIDVNATDIHSTDTFSVSASGDAETLTGTVGIALDTGTGKTVGVTFSADPTAGQFVVIVEFIEHTLNNGKLLNIDA